jgi:hypothetical protein
MEPIRIAIVGVGKIARDQHMPAIEGSPAFSLAATVSPHHPGKEGVPHAKSLDELLEQGPAIDAVVQANLVPAHIGFDPADQMKILSEHRRLLDDSLGPEHAFIAAPFLAIAREARRDGADPSVER